MDARTRTSESVGAKEQSAFGVSHLPPPKAESAKNAVAAKKAAAVKITLKVNLPESKEVANANKNITAEKLEQLLWLVRLDVNSVEIAPLGIKSRGENSQTAPVT